MDQAGLDAQAAHDARMSRDEDVEEVVEAYLRLLRIYEDSIDPVERPRWVGSAERAAERLVPAPPGHGEGVR